MVTGNFIAASRNIAQYYNVNGRDLAQSYVRVATGHRFSTPSDNIIDYLRSKNMDRTTNGYRAVRSDIEQARGMSNMAETVGKTVYEGINRMKDLVNLYYGDTATADEKIAYRVEFQGLIQETTNIISSSKYDGKRLVADSSATPLRSVNLDPNNQAQQFSISFAAADVADVSTLDITVGKDNALLAVGTELDKAGGYLAKAVAFTVGLDSQLRLTDNKILVSDDQVGSIRNIDTGTEISRQVDYSIRNSSSIAMMGQANMYAQGILKLFR